MAANSANTPVHEYNKVDTTCILVFANNSELPLTDRWEEATFNPNGTAGTLKGSGRFRRAHTSETFEPTFAITLDLDLATAIQKRRGSNAIKQVKLIRQRPGGAPITDLINWWKPPIGEMAYGDDPSTCELSGEALSFTLDATNKIVIA
jgi:hypothetical protein